VARRPLPLVLPTQGSLVEALEQRTIAGELVERGPGASLTCVACAHRCVLSENKRGICGVRRHHAGELHVPWGYVARKYVRAVETNTVFHVRPGARALTFGLFGCDLHCPYCHNAALSQALRDDLAGNPIDITPAALVDEAVSVRAEVICAAYNEPMIAAEWVHAVFLHAKRAGLVTALVSDGHSTPNALAYLRSVTDVYRVDLKGFSEAQYRTLGGRLRPVLEAIREAKRLGYWVEVVTLVVPGLNDDAGGLCSLGDQLRGIDPAMPWHINAFVPRYRLSERPSPSAEFLVSVAGTAYARGSRFVYVGNAPRAATLAHTRCPGCHELLIERRDYATTRVALQDRACSRCRAPVPGLF
jgi:pyruvate formate lyase activating enzyme